MKSKKTYAVFGLGRYKYTKEGKIDNKKNSVFKK